MRLKADDLTGEDVQPSTPPPPPLFRRSATQSHFWNNESSRLTPQIRGNTRLERLLYEALNEKIK